MHDLSLLPESAFLLAQFKGVLAGWGIGHYLIAIVAIAAGIALMYVALNKFGVKIPEWAIQVFWIVVVAIVVIGAIRLVFAL